MELLGEKEKKTFSKLPLLSTDKEMAQSPSADSGIAPSQAVTGNTQLPIPLGLCGAQGGDVAIQTSLHLENTCWHQVSQREEAQHPAKGHIPAMPRLRAASAHC